MVVATYVLSASTELAFLGLVLLSRQRWIIFVLESSKLSPGDFSINELKIWGLEPGIFLNTSHMTTCAIYRI